MARPLEEIWKQEEELRKTATQSLDRKSKGSDRKTERPARKGRGFFGRGTTDPSIPERGQRIERRRA